MEQKLGKILIVDDNEDLLKAARMYLKRHFAQVDTEKNPEALPAPMNNEDYDVAAARDIIGWNVFFNVIPPPW